MYNLPVEASMRSLDKVSRREMVTLWSVLMGRPAREPDSVSALVTTNTIELQHPNTSVAVYIITKQALDLHRVVVGYVVSRMVSREMLAEVLSRLWDAVLSACCYADPPSSPPHPPSSPPRPPSSLPPPGTLTARRWALSCSLASSSSPTTASGRTLTVSTRHRNPTHRGRYQYHSIVYIN